MDHQPDLSASLTFLRRSAPLIAAIAVLVTAAAAIYAFTASAQYTSRVQLFVAAQDQASQDLSAAYDGGLFAQQRVQSYSDLVDSPLVLRPVIEELGLRTTVTKLATHVTAGAPTDTVLLNISVTARSSGLAQRTAEAIGTQLITVITGLERTVSSAGGGTGVVVSSPVKVAVSNPANRPTGPSSPKKAEILIAGIFLGLLLGILVAFVRQRLDSRLHDLDAIRDTFDVTVLGAIPVDRAAGRDIVPAFDNVHDIRVEPLNELRTNVQFASLDHPPKMIAVTSSLIGEGKTTTSASLAVTLARAGHSVILVEGDLRKPRLAPALRLDPKVGVGSVLLGSMSLDDALQTIPAYESLHVLVAGGYVPNPAEVVGSQRMQELLAELRERAEYVIIDAPPLLAVTDGALLAAASDAVLLVTQPGRITRHQLRGALRALEHVHARVLGIVANQVALSEGTYYGYRYGTPLTPTESPQVTADS